MMAQVLADFIVEVTIPDKRSDNKFDDKSEQAKDPTIESISVWVLHIDGASNTQRSRASLILTNFEGTVTEYTLRFNFKVSNNQVEYEALLAGLKIAKELG